MEENWVVLEGYSKHYELSDQGRVRYKMKHGYRVVKARKRGKKMYCTLTGKNGKKIEKQICAMVAYHFRGDGVETPDPREILSKVDRIGSTFFM